MDYKDKIQVMYQTKDGRYVAILKDDYRLDGSIVIEGDLNSVIADVLRADRWVTINGSHVLIGKNGKIMAGMGGKFKGFPFGARFSDKGQTTKSGKKIARLYKAQKAEYNGQKVVKPISAKRAKIRELIKKYKISASGNYNELSKDKWKLLMYKPGDKDLAFIRKNRNQIFEELEAAVSNKAKRKSAVYANRRNAVQGLNEIEKAETAWYKYDLAKKRAHERESGISPKRPDIPTVSELLSKYPRAAALRQMENWGSASNYTKASIGNKAAKDILNGVNYKKVVAKAEKDWSDYTKERMWD